MRLEDLVVLGTKQAGIPDFDGIAKVFGELPEERIQP